MLSSLVLLLLGSASADEIVVERGGLFPVEVWVDGQHRGRLKGRRPLKLTVAPGEHEVWIARDAENRMVRCYGLADVQGELSLWIKANDEDGTCDGLRPGRGPEGATAWAGAMFELRMQEVTRWVTLDTHPATLPVGVYRWNLRPGMHQLNVYSEPFRKTVSVSRTFTVHRDRLLQVTCEKGRCLGFTSEQRPVP